MRKFWRVFLIVEIVGFMAATYYVTYRLAYLRGSIRVYEATQPYINSLRENIKVSDELINRQDTLIDLQQSMLFQKPN